jgi:hypothetical protein
MEGCAYADAPLVVTLLGAAIAQVHDVQVPSPFPHEQQRPGTCSLGHVCVKEARADCARMTDS